MYSAGVMTWNYPIAVSQVLKIVTWEANPSLWLSDNHITVFSTAENSIDVTKANIVSMAAINGTVVPTNATVSVLMIGRA